MIPPDVQSNVHIWPNDPKVHRRDENRVKTQKPQDKIPGTPKIFFWGSKPENPQGRVGSRLFSTWPSTCQSIKNDQEVRKAMFFTAAEVW